jgi:hypothetical protein
MGWEPLPSERETTHTLQDALVRLHRTMGVARPDAVRILEGAWPSLVGRRLARSCWLESLRGGQMVVGVSDPAVAEHLRWQSRDLAAAANDLCGGTVVEEVVTRVRDRPPDAAARR